MNDMVQAPLQNDPVAAQPAAQPFTPQASPIHRCGCGSPVQRGHEDLAIADLAGARRLDERLDRAVDECVSTITRL